MWLWSFSHICQLPLPGFFPCLKNAPTYTSTILWPPKSTHSCQKMEDNIISNPVWCSVGRRIADVIIEVPEFPLSHLLDPTTVLTFDPFQDTTFCDFLVFTTPSYFWRSHNPALDLKTVPQYLAFSPCLFHYLIPPSMSPRSQKGEL